MADVSPLPRALIAAARAFNNGEYFEAHEILEDALDDVPDELWELFIGLIQIAVGYHKTTQQLWSGAAAMLERALAKVEPFPPEGGGIQIEQLRARVRADRDALRAGTFNPAALRAHPPRLVITKARQDDSTK